MRSRTLRKAPHNQLLLTIDPPFYLPYLIDVF
jgi:hypothetical protein